MMKKHRHRGFYNFEQIYNFRQTKIKGEKSK